MSSKSDSPTDPFKRALAHAARSLAESPDLEVVYAGDGPSLTAGRLTLPHPPRDLSAADAARIRGMADQMALRLAHHDDAAHAKHSPRDPSGAAAFEAIEQARIDAIGANALIGVRDNLAAVWEQAAQRKGMANVVDPAAAPIADVVALMVRERLTGAPPPLAARALVDSLREQIEAKAGADLDRLTGAVERKGMTLVPLSVYFNRRGRAKVELALARGKNTADKRATIKERDWKREQSRIMREYK